MRRSPILIAAVVAACLAVPVFAASTTGIDRSARGTERADHVDTPVADVITIYNSGALRHDVANRAFAATRAAGGTAAIGRSASTGMQRVRRGSTMVQQAPPGWAYPMGTTILPLELIGPIMGRDIAGYLSASSIVMGRRTADLRGAQQGDVIDLVASGGNVISFTIGAVVDDAITGGTELLLAPSAADRLGITRLSRIVLWGFESRSAIDAALAAEGLVSTSIRIRRSWDQPDPDSTLGMARTKEALGEFAYYVNPASGAVSIENAWHSQYISKAGPIGQLKLQNGCHVTVRASLQNAMNELIAAGLEYTINYAHANTAGGCYLARFSRFTTNSSIGFLSRHTWGMAIDTNTLGSCQGCAPPDMDCRTVRIFRKHGFAWGGNFLRPDGMHFEWVGERRDLLPYPSRFCQNDVGAGAGSLESSGGGTADPAALDIEGTQRAVMFADDGLLAEG